MKLFSRRVSEEFVLSANNQEVLHNFLRSIKVRFDNCWFGYFSVSLSVIEHVTTIWFPFFEEFVFKVLSFANCLILMVFFFFFEFRKASLLWKKENNKEDTLCISCIVVVDLSQHGSPACGATDRKEDLEFCLKILSCGNHFFFNHSKHYICAQMLQGKTCQGYSQVRKENSFLFTCAFPSNKMCYVPFEASSATW